MKFSASTWMPGWHRSDRAGAIIPVRTLGLFHAGTASHSALATLVAHPARVHASHDAHGNCDRSP